MLLLLGVIPGSHSTWLPTSFIHIYINTFLYLYIYIYIYYVSYLYRRWKISRVTKIVISCSCDSCLRSEGTWKTKIHPNQTQSKSNDHIIASKSHMFKSSHQKSSSISIPWLLDSPFVFLDSRVCSREALEEVNNKLQPSSFPKRVTPRKWNKWPDSKQFEWVEGWKCPAPNSCNSKRHLGEDSPNFLLKWCDIGIVHLDECLTFFHVQVPPNEIKYRNAFFGSSYLKILTCVEASWQWFNYL